jgi:hypothetical protein
MRGCLLIGLMHILRLSDLLIGGLMFILVEAMYG